MWMPTHVKVTVEKAKGLLIKGKNNTNDAFVTIGLGKESFRTSILEKVADPAEWHEECELAIPKQGNTAEIILTVLHRSLFGVDEFLGTLAIPLSDFDNYDRARTKWYPLKSKSKEKTKYRGELEVRVAFTIKSGSMSDLSKKESHKGSLSHISHMAHSVGGSLLSLGSKEGKGLKKFAKNVGHKVSTLPLRKKKDGSGRRDSIRSIPEKQNGQKIGEADPGVISDSDDDFRFDELSHKSSGSSLAAPPPGLTPLNGSLEDLAGGEFLRKSYGTPPKGLIQNMPPIKPPALAPMDEWDAKLFGHKGQALPEVKHRGLGVGSSRTLSHSASSSSLGTPSLKEENNVSSANNSNRNSIHSQKDIPILLEGNEIIKIKEPISPIKKKSKSKENVGLKVPSGFSLGLSKTKEEKQTLSAFQSVARIATSPCDLSSQGQRVVEGGEDTTRATDRQAFSGSKLAPIVTQKFQGMSRDDLIEMVIQLQGQMDDKSSKLKDMEDYIDHLLLRVMETTPRILQNPYSQTMKALPTIKHG